jgi:GNAT superfamily N-acetyltransferase
MIGGQVVIIREATADDSKALGGLLAELGYEVEAGELPERLARFCTQGNGQVILAFIETTPVAFAALEITFPIHHAQPVAHLSSCAVAATARRQGIGKLLLAAVEQKAREAGCRRVVVTSAEHRDDAHSFYPAAGWHLTGRRFGKDLD